MQERSLNIYVFVTVTVLIFAGRLVQYTNPICFTGFLTGHNNAKGVLVKSDHLLRVQRNLPH